ncbi:murein L,D-transpeptidase catalytic domain family protein [Marinobacter xestospongiae]|uniref:Murein L,D-transpeptidase catalytic domain family protein n=1 Tax=Marinobacter xestospongiae TaxID=994319 RepID=A0ABU3VUK2_9GAMM|nr:murein L,D-transpeptidase catalytic domain family protein [Marinobacter xestospongiae]MDV2077881.1 murein L,D-transpeptidase catalytic domain family protein [Marinobacter xestospongiae]
MTVTRHAPLLNCLFAVLAFSLPLRSLADPAPSALYHQLVKAAPALDEQVLGKALMATQCAVRHGVSEARRLAVIDYSLPSSEPRLWLFDLDEGRLVLRDRVAHGKNSGLAAATEFSNIEGSHQSSIGLFRASESYRGRHGYSLRLDGLEPGINDQARQRAIVIHGADYVAQSWVEDYGRIGRSLGCPAVSQGMIREVVDNLKGGQLVFSYYPDAQWLAASEFLNCDDAQVADAGSRPASGDS